MKLEKKKKKKNQKILKSEKNDSKKNLNLGSWKVASLDIKWSHFKKVSISEYLNIFIFVSVSKLVSSNRNYYLCTFLQRINYIQY